MMNLYSCCTPPYEIFLRRWFLPTLKDDYELVLIRDSESPAGNFASEGWLHENHRRIDIIIHAIEENWGGMFLHSDIDIQFFGKTEELIQESLRDLDFIALKDASEDLTLERVPEMCGHLCAGFFACRANERTWNLWKNIKEFCAKNPTKNDQQALNFFLNGFDASRKENRFGVTWDYLPPPFYSPGPCLGISLWNPGKTLHIPPNIVVHHANWTIGIENKLAQLKYVRKMWQSR